MIRALNQERSISAQAALNQSSKGNANEDPEILEWESKLDHSSISWPH